MYRHPNTVRLSQSSLHSQSPFALAEAQALAYKNQNEASCAKIKACLLKHTAEYPNQPFALWVEDNPSNLFFLKNFTIPGMYQLNKNDDDDKNLIQCFIDPCYSGDKIDILVKINLLHLLIKELQQIHPDIQANFAIFLDYELGDYKVNGQNITAEGLIKNLKHFQDKNKCTLHIVPNSSNNAYFKGKIPAELELTNQDNKICDVERAQKLLASATPACIMVVT